MAKHIEALAVLKKRLIELLELQENIEKRITALLTQKEEVLALCESVQESIKVLGIDSRKELVEKENQTIKELNDLSYIQKRVEENPLPGDENEDPIDHS